MTITLVIPDDGDSDRIRAFSSWNKANDWVCETYSPNEWSFVDVEVDPK